MNTCLPVKTLEFAKSVVLAVVLLMVKSSGMSGHVNL